MEEDKDQISAIPILDLSSAHDPVHHQAVLTQLRSALFDVGFLYIRNHGIPHSTISRLTDLLPALFDLSDPEKVSCSKTHSPHFLGYSGFAEEVTLGQKDLREQFDFATELPVVYRDPSCTDRNYVLSDGDGNRDFIKPYWRLRGPNQWPSEDSLPCFRQAFTDYHDAVQKLSYRFVHLIEEAFNIPVGTFDHFFGQQHAAKPQTNGSLRAYMPPQHRIKLIKYPPSSSPDAGQGVGAHKDSSGWLTFLLQVGNEPGLEVLSADGGWIKAPPIEGTFVVNFGNAFEAATEGAVKATTHRVIAPGPDGNVRYSIPFFQGLPLDMTVSEIRGYILQHVRTLRKQHCGGEDVSTFLDPRWDSLGESQLRKWIRSHQDVAMKWYGPDLVKYYTAS